MAESEPEPVFLTPGTTANETKPKQRRNPKQYFSPPGSVVKT